jgi:hypothetical protein
VSELADLLDSLNASHRALQLQEAALDERARGARRDGLAALRTALAATGDLLHVAGSMVGPERVSAASTRGNATDVLVGMARICQVAEQLIVGAEQLLTVRNG